MTTAFLGADTQELHDAGQKCEQGGQTTDEVITFLKALVVALKAASFFTGGASAAYAQYLETVVIPWLQKVSAALHLFAKVLGAHADAQDKASAGESVDPGSLPTYQTPGQLPSGDTTSYPQPGATTGPQVAVPAGHDTAAIGTAAAPAGSPATPTFTPSTHDTAGSTGTAGSGTSHDAFVPGGGSTGGGGASGSWGGTDAGTSGTGGTDATSALGGGTGATAGAPTTVGQPGVTDASTYGGGDAASALGGGQSAHPGTPTMTGDQGASHGSSVPMAAGGLGAAGALGAGGAALAAKGKLGGDQTTGEGHFSPSGYDYNKITGVSGNPRVTPEFLRKVEQVASNVGTKPEYLMGVMSAETNGHFSAGIKNPTSSATGLIQFTSGTAKGLGTTTAALREMTPTQQLDYVEKYLMPRRGHLGSLEGLYSTVLAGSGKTTEDPSAVLLTKGAHDGYEGNHYLDEGPRPDGRITAGEAADSIRARIKN